MQTVRSLLLQYLHVANDDLLVKATSMGGVDLHLSPEAARYFPFAIEVKCQESLNIWAALAQAAANAEGKPPIVFFKRARTELFVALRAEDLLKQLWPRSAPTPPPMTPDLTPSPTPSSS